MPLTVSPNASNETRTKFEYIQQRMQQQRTVRATRPLGNVGQPFQPNALQNWFTSVQQRLGGHYFLINTSPTVIWTITNFWNMVRANPVDYLVLDCILGQDGGLKRILCLEIMLEPNQPLNQLQVRQLDTRIVIEPNTPQHRMEIHLYGRI